MPKNEKGSTENRETENHTHDISSSWDRRTRRRVRAIYGGAVGLGVLIVAYIFGRMLLADGNLTFVEAMFIGGFAIAGLVAAMPGTFMPAVHKLVDLWQSRGKGDS